MVWLLTQRATGQIRIGGMGGVAGFDMSAVFAMADALGIDRRIVAELMPAAEGGMVAAVNRQDGD